MAKKKKRFQFQLGLPGLIFSVGLFVCLFLWTFVLGFYLGQKMMASRVEKISSPITKKALKGEKSGLKPPPVYEEVSPPPLVGKKLAEEKASEKKASSQTKPKPPVEEKGPSKKELEAKKQEPPSPQVALKEKKPEPKKEAPSLAKVEPPSKPKPLPETKPPSPSIEKAGPFYSVQVSSLRSMEEAQKYLNYLRERGYEAFIKRISLPQKGVWYRVYVGRFKSFSEARKFGEELKKREKLKSFYVQKLGASK